MGRSSSKAHQDLARGAIYGHVFIHQAEQSADKSEFGRGKSSSHRCTERFSIPLVSNWTSKQRGTAGGSGH